MRLIIKKPLTIIGICLSAIGLVPYIPVQAESPSQAEVKAEIQSSLDRLDVYTDTQEGIKFKYPASWQKKEEKEGPIFFSFAVFKGIVNVNVGSEKLPDGVTLETYADSTREQVLKSEIPRATPVTLLAQTETTLGTLPARQMTYTYSFSEPKVPVKVVQRLAITKTRAYIFTYTAVSDLYDDFLKVFDEVLKSVEFS